MSIESTELFIELVATLSIPSRAPIVSGLEHEQRNWAVRFSRVFPNGNDVLKNLKDKLTMMIDNHLRILMKESLNIDNAIIPHIDLLRIDDYHVIVHIETIKLEEDVHYIWWLSACTALNVLDSFIEIEDVQGIPKRYWRFLFDSAPQESVK